MTIDELASQSLLCWVARELPRHRALSRQELPNIDLPYFFRGLAKLDLPGPLSLAVVGFDLKAGHLAALKKKHRVAHLAYISEDLHEAGDWRNKRGQHPYNCSPIPFYLNPILASSSAYWKIWRPCKSCATLVQGN